MRPSTAAKTSTNNTTPKVSAADSNKPSRSDSASAISAMIAAGGILESGNGKVSKTTVSSRTTNPVSREEARTNTGQRGRTAVSSRVSSGIA